MSPAAAIPDKVVKIIPRLASDHEGEVLATVAALRRTLEGAGLTLHDLAAAVSSPPVILRTQTPEPPRQPKRQEPRFTFANLAPGAARRVIAEILALDTANDWEVGFLESVSAQLRTRPDKLLSSAQIRTLNGLWRKTLGAQ